MAEQGDDDTNHTGGAATGTNGTQPKESPFERILRLTLGGLTFGAMVSLRALLPLMEVYVARRRSEIEGGDVRTGSGFTAAEEEIIGAAGEKALYEMLELASVASPVFKGAPPYVAAVNPETGIRQPPSLVHLLALANGAKMLILGAEDGRGSDGDPPKPDSQVASQPVVYMAVAPGEYVMAPGPLRPVEIRRAANRQRSYNQSALAMLGAPQPAMTSAPRRVMASTSRPMLVAAPTPAQRYVSAPKAAAGQAAHGCSCGGHGGHSCSCGGHADACRCGVPPGKSLARYDDDGDCASIFDISCETRWRIRECFKVAFCDALRCFGDSLCVKEGEEAPKLEECLQDVLCCFFRCLPDAICPPEKQHCLPSKPYHDCARNFAVGE